MKLYKHFLLGFLLGALIFSSINVFADSIAIEAFFNDIKISLDGKVIELKDSKGNKVEPFIHEGTTYLPVKAIAEILGMEVKYNETTNTVELTKKKGGAIALRQYDPSKGESYFDEEHSGMNGILWDVYFYITPEELKSKYPYIEVSLEGDLYIISNSETSESVEVDINGMRIMGFPNCFEHEGKTYINYDSIVKIMPKEDETPRRSFEIIKIDGISVRQYDNGEKYVMPSMAVSRANGDPRLKFAGGEWKVRLNESNSTVDFYKLVYPSKGNPENEIIVLKDVPAINVSESMYSAFVTYDAWINDILPKLLEALKTE